MTVASGFHSTTTRNLAVFIDADNAKNSTALDHVPQALRSIAAPLSQETLSPALNPEKSPTSSTVQPQSQTALAAQALAAISVKDILRTLPELKDKVPLHLSQAAKRLGNAGLLARKVSSVLLFRRYAAQFELTPAQQPHVVRYRG